MICINPLAERKSELLFVLTNFYLREYFDSLSLSSLSLFLSDSLSRMWRLWPGFQRGQHHFKRNKMETTTVYYQSGFPFPVCEWVFFGSGLHRCEFFIWSSHFFAFANTMPYNIQIHKHTHIHTNAHKCYPRQCKKEAMSEKQSKQMNKKPNRKTQHVERRIAQMYNKQVIQIAKSKFIT